MVVSSNFFSIYLKHAEEVKVAFGVDCMRENIFTKLAFPFISNN